MKIALYFFVVMSAVFTDITNYTLGLGISYYIDGSKNNSQVQQYNSREIIFEDGTGSPPLAERKLHFTELLDKIPFAKARVFNEYHRSDAKDENKLLQHDLTRFLPTEVHSPGEVPKNHFAPLSDVSVTCSNTKVVIRVKPTFYGFSAIADELTLGGTCKSNGVLKPYGDLLFTYSLTDCGGTREVSPEYITYKFVLYYIPTTRLPVHRSHRVSVDIECRFKRYHHVYQMALRPTWRTPTRRTIRGQSGEFRLQLMDASWTTPAKSNIYLLGQTVNVQVSALYVTPGAKLFVHHCYVTTTAHSVAESTDSTMHNKYDIIQNFGCLLESQKNPYFSQFRSPRTDDTLRFSFDAFQFIVDPDRQIFLHCKLSVSADGPSPTHKSCTYREYEKRWIALTGDNSLCDCCDSSCLPVKSKRAMYEGFVSSRPMIFSTESSVIPPVSSFNPLPLNSDLRQESGKMLFETKLDKDRDGLYGHTDFTVPTAMPSIYGHADVMWVEDFEDDLLEDQNNLGFNTSIVEYTEEERTKDEKGKGQLEISKGFVSIQKLQDRERPKGSREELTSRIWEMLAERKGLYVGSGHSTRESGISNMRGSWEGERSYFGTGNESVSQEKSMISIHDWNASVTKKQVMAAELTKEGVVMESEMVPVSLPEKEGVDSFDGDRILLSFLHSQESGEDDFLQAELVERGIVNELEL